MPTGTATPGTTTWLTAWAAVSSVAPARREAGTRNRWSSPTRPRAMCGPTRPTKPMIPTKATDSAASRETPTRDHERRRETSMPMAAARASPRVMAVRRQPLTQKTGVATTRATVTAPTAGQVARMRDPMDQKTICCRLSVEARYCTRARRAWQLKTSAMPSRIVVSLVTEGMRETSAMVREAVRPAVMAEIARVAPPTTGSTRPVTIARDAPRAEAAEMPRVKGSASGLSRMVCICTPARDRAPPTSTASSAGGSRRLMTTSATRGS